MARGEKKLEEKDEAIKRQETRGCEAKNRRMWRERKIRKRPR